MKDIFESPEVMAAFAEIDMHYYFIEDMQKEWNKPLSPIEAAIDKATGYDVERIKKIKEKLIYALEQIIKNKKIIEADYSGDEKMLKALQTLSHEDEAEIYLHHPELMKNAEELPKPPQR